MTFRRERLRILPPDNGNAELVTCERFEARLTKAACVARYKRTERGGRMGDEMNLVGCQGCSQGKGRVA